MVLEAVKRGDEGRGLAGVGARGGVNVDVNGVLGVLYPARIARLGNARHLGVISGPVDLPLVPLGEVREVASTQDRVPDVDPEAGGGGRVDRVDADELPVATVARDGSNVGRCDFEVAIRGVHIEVEARAASARPVRPRSA